MTTKPTNQTIVFPVPKRVKIECRDIPDVESGWVLICTRKTLISIGTE